ncbi:MFS transporter [Aldersonia sp. NBC_00410]|uniref:MFS transporter n=1 Tax=Aldersonia sp. NBC_00410 TaxID=2975954 RepID=UPI0022517B9C|nr:MFS transporter [Aldersonia sp. NBC_00410]MCX5043499.1 MFS transporter [Aldersonia sp. NBC_00410]
MQTTTAPASNRLDFATVWLVGVACAALSIVVAAMAALNTALPDMAPELHASSNQLTWIIDGYTLCLAALLLPAGAIGDRFGRREILVVGLVVFAIASVLPLGTSDPTIFIATRCLAGVGAAMAMPATLSLISAGVPEDKRPIAISIWAGVGGAGAIAGFFVTGLLLEVFSWHSVFITFAISGCLVAALACTIPTSKDPNPAAFDWLGSTTSALAIAVFVCGLIEAPQRGWLDPLVLTALIGGLALAVVFVRLQQHGRRRLLDVALFANRSFSAGALCISLQFFASLGAFFLLLQRFQLVMGYSPLKSAVALLPMVVVLMCMAIVGNWLAERFELRAILASGILLAGIGLLLLGVFNLGEYWQICASFGLTAVGIGIATAPSTTAILVNTPQDRQGIGSAINDTARELGGAIGIALAGSIVAAGYSDRIAATADAARNQVMHATAPLAGTEQSAQIAAQADQLHEHVSRSLAEAMAVAEQVGAQQQPALAARIAEGAEHAFVTPMNNAMILLGAIMLVGAAVLAWRTPKTLVPEAD